MYVTFISSKRYVSVNLQRTTGWDTVLSGFDTNNGTVRLPSVPVIHPPPSIGRNRKVPKYAAEKDSHNEYINHASSGRQDSGSQRFEQKRPLPVSFIPFPDDPGSGGVPSIKDRIWAYPFTDTEENILPTEQRMYLLTYFAIPRTDALLCWHNRDKTLIQLSASRQVYVTPASWQSLSLSPPAGTMNSMPSRTSWNKLLKS